MLEIARVLVQIYLPNKGKKWKRKTSNDLQDSLEILKADKFKQGRDYSSICWFILRYNIRWKLNMGFP